MQITISELRGQIFKMFDRVIRSGKPLTVVRNGHTLKIVPEKKEGRLAGVKVRDGLLVDPDEIAETSWESEWNDDFS